MPGGGWSQGNIWAYRPELSLLSDQIVEQKQIPALCVFLSFWGGSRRVDIGATVKDVAKTIRNPPKERGAHCQRSQRQPRFKKLRHLTCLDLEVFRADI